MRVIQVALSLLILTGPVEAKGTVACHATYNEIVELLKMLSGDVRAYQLEWRKYSGAAPREAFENDQTVRAQAISHYSYFTADLNAIRLRISKGLRDGCARRYHYDLIKMNVAREIDLMSKIGNRWWVER